MELDAGEDGPESASFAAVEASNVVIETIKQAEDGKGVILRMYESENAYTKTSVTVNADFGKAYVCNLLEEAEQEAQVSGRQIAVTLKPYEVVTLKLV